MKTPLTLKPGDRGTRRLVVQYGPSLYRVRYRYDADKKVRLKTVELIVEERPWTPPIPDEVLVSLRVAFDEAALRQKVKEAGGRWDSKEKVWRISYGDAKRLRLQGRIAGTPGKGKKHIPVDAK